MKRGVTKYNFLLGIDKPSGMTSHDVVNCVRHALGEGRVGHMGTLDPLASGVLLVGVGAANRLNQFLAGHDKTYEVVARFGSATNTYDCEGEITETSEVPSKFADAEFATAEVNKLVGKHTQKPPAFSAVKINGKAAYKYARAGKEVEIPEREVEIYSAKLLHISCNKNVEWQFRVQVSGGTYIRTLVHDLGKRLGCPAHVVQLRRTAIGECRVEDCISLESLNANAKKTNDNAPFTEQQVASLDKVNPLPLLGFTPYEIDDISHKKTKTGQVLAGWEFLVDEFAENIEVFCNIAFTHNYKLAAIYHLEQASGCRFAMPVVVFPQDIEMDAMHKQNLTDTVCTFGVFDGIHAGHKFQIKSAIESAQLHNAKSGIITFDIDPDELFKKDFKKLMSNAQRIRQLRKADTDFVEVIPFNKIKNLEPEAFLDTYFGDGNIPHELHVGSNFHFGKHATGTTQTLQNWGARHNMKVIVHDLLEKDGVVISSTNIRKGLI